MIKSTAQVFVWVLVWVWCGHGMGMDEGVGVSVHFVVWSLQHPFGQVFLFLCADEKRRSVNSVTRALIRLLPEHHSQGALVARTRRPDLSAR